MGAYLERSAPASKSTDAEGWKSEAEKELLRRLPQGPDGRIPFHALTTRLGIPEMVLSDVWVASPI